MAVLFVVDGVGQYVASGSGVGINVDKSHFVVVAFND
jgi:hypothetical protein